MKRSILCILFMIVTYQSRAQLYYVSGIDQLIELNITGTTCSSSIVGPFINSATGASIFAGDIAICPNGKLYINTNQYTYEVNPSNAACTLVASASSYLGISALGCTSSNELYGVGSFPTQGSVYEIDVTAGTTLPAGTMPFSPSGDLVFWGGNAYMASFTGIVNVNIGNPAASTLLFPTPPYVALTILADDCNALLAGSGTQLTRIDLTTGATTPLCSISQTIGGLTTPSEFTTTPECPFEIDLDKNDSSGASDFDFNGSKINCLSDREQPIADSDTKIICSKAINNMYISIGAGLQSPGLEYLSLTSSIPNIAVGGNGTTNITLSNTGSATLANFENALKAIKYANYADPLIGGTREIIVQGFDIIADPSNVATAFIEVEILPSIPLELGDNIEKCANDAITINANAPNSIYDWSTGDITESIEVTNPGYYKLTVTNGVNCPSIDDITVVDKPQYSVFLSGGGVLCPGEKAFITCNTTYDDLLDITLFNQSGLQYNYYNIQDGFTFEVPSTTSSYTLTTSTAIGTQCLTNGTNEVNVVLAPTYSQSNTLLICKGDSVLLNSTWIKKEGTFQSTFQSVYGCDSLIATTVNVLPVDSTFQTQQTCDISAIGIIYVALKNKNNCDSIVVKNLVYSAPDTTKLFETTCFLNLAGVFTNPLKNKNGCDSIVSTNVKYVKSDSTFIAKKTCDISKAGTFIQALSSYEGCDSIVTTNVKYVKSDSTFIAKKTCDISKAGTFIQALLSFEGCDSIVTTNVKYVKSDSTIIAKKTCDISKAGTFIQALLSFEGCDSIVTTNVKYVKSDSTIIAKKTCDISKAGTFIQALLSFEGCDSIVTTNVKYVKSDSTFIAKKTCDISKAGTFIQALLSSEGCDSIVTTNVKYVKSDSTFIAKKTCDISKAGTFIQALLSSEGCDSIVTTNVKYVESDSTFIAKKTCDISKAGTFIQALLSYEGCDSIVTTNVKYVESDSTFIAKKTCDISKAGTFIQALLSYEGCDSIVTTIVKYVKSDSTIIAKKTCDISKAGTFIQALLSFEGCDSIILTYIQFISSDTISLIATTCLKNEAGLKTLKLTNINGCDSLITINVKYVGSLAKSFEKYTCNELEVGESQLVLTNVNGCDSIISIAVKLLPIDSCGKKIDYYFSNIIVKNNQGSNNVFTVYSNQDNVMVEALDIYDRWGNKVFSKRKFPTNNNEYGWNGTMNENDLVSGVYVYHCKVLEGNGFKDIMGTVTLIE